MLFITGNTGCSVIGWHIDVASVSGQDNCSCAMPAHYLPLRYRTTLFLNLLDRWRKAAGRLQLYGPYMHVYARYGRVYKVRVGVSMACHCG